jgi:broad specificity phosphatase PhoE
MGLALVYLVRHGVTAYNHEGRYQGQRDVPLAPEGREQAERLAARLRATPFDAAWSSDLVRARDTAAAVLRGRPGPELQVSAGFREMDYGAWEGLTFREVAARYPSAWHAYQTGGEDVAPPGGESVAQVVARARAAFAALWRDDLEHVLLVAHGAVLKLLLLDLLGADRGLRRSLVLDNASVSLLRLGRGRPRLLLLNDTCHLQDRPPARS